MMTPGPSADPADRRLTGQYTGDLDSLLPLALRTALLTLVTVGLYRFWERTRIRRYVWSSISPGGDPFEYTGTGLEKLLGFLVAVVILAVTLGLVQLALTFAGLSVLAPTAPGAVPLGAGILFGLSSALLVPLGAFARYRAYRYRMARTRWRGIRFGVRPGAFGYAWRSTLYLVLTVASLGLLWPLMTFQLEKYRADRTFFGDARLHQGGRWTMLYAAALHVLLGVGLCAMGAVLLLAGAGLGLLLLLAGPIWMLVGAVVYRARCFTLLTRTKTLGGTIRFGADVRGTEMVPIVIWGGLKVVLAGTLVSAIFAAVLAASGAMSLLDGPPEANVLSDPTVLQTVLSVGGTLLTLMMYGLLYLVFVQQPVLAYQVTHSWVENPVPLTAIKQRGADDFADADGFADALDVGGGF